MFSGFLQCLVAHHNNIFVGGTLLIDLVSQVLTLPSRQQTRLPQLHQEPAQTLSWEEVSWRLRINQGASAEPLQGTGLFPGP